MKRNLNPPSQTIHQDARFGVIIPACNEEACIGTVLEELLQVINPEKFIVIVGVNGSSDRTAEIARKYPVLVAETAARGYGHGCTAAVELIAKRLPSLRAYIFLAADGANDPRDIYQLASRYEQGYHLVLGARTGRPSNWRIMELSHVIANFALGLWCGFLSGRWFTDLGPLRLIDRKLFEALAMCEMTFGWTIEAQLGAAKLGATICEVPVHERQRVAGEQKVSGVTWRQTFSIGCQIVAAGWRTRLRFQEEARRLWSRSCKSFLPQA